MIATLSGTVEEKFIDHVVISVSGVGYGVFVTNEDYGNLAKNEQAKVYVYEHIREQSHDLFGFTDAGIRQFFELLLSVNGVGPKMALNVLSIGNAADVRAAIAEGNVNFIQQASGVGKRVAERIVVDLKDKVGLTATDLSSTGILSSENNQDEATQALMALGYSSSDAARALSAVDSSLPLDERVKLALKGN
jgi:Holliday junction DNA helicase RuvA